MAQKLEVSIKSPFLTAFLIAEGVILSVVVLRPVMIASIREPDPPPYVVEFSPELAWPRATKWEGGRI
ncbi:hypothetical protein DLM45_10870 [Hyphomicrobium methylovorum]|nr:hypothetical protein [Hyphomicrobium methylovorum]